MTKLTKQQRSVIAKKCWAESPKLRSTLKNEKLIEFYNKSNATQLIDRQARKASSKKANARKSRKSRR